MKTTVITKRKGKRNQVETLSTTAPVQLYAYTTDVIRRARVLHSNRGNH